jgi:hypothetical protein
MDYTAVGDTTNIAARMESLARPDTVFVSEQTYRLVRDFFEFEPMGSFVIKGKEAHQKAFKLIKQSEVGTRIEASAAKGLTRFVGRRNSMAALTKVYDKAKSGSGQVVALVGEAGVGKSRLLLEMRSILPWEEYIYLEGRCLHFGGSMAYLPILDILRSYFEIKESDREFIIKKKMKEKILDLDEKSNGVLSPFHEIFSLKTEDEKFAKLEPKERRERTFEAIRNLLIQLSHEKILVLAIEDLHWIDKTSEDFLDYLIGWLANSRILLILLYRPEYTHQWGSKSYYTKIGLDHLGTESSTDLIRAILEEGDVASELKQLILNRAAGNPLFMEEFTHTLLENGSIKREGKNYALSLKASEIQVPDTIQGIIAARMDRLEDNLKRTMQVASVIGRDFAFRILQTITGMREELKSYLLNLQGLEFIYEKQLFPELEYIFKHALTQEVAYNSLLLKRRKEIHERIGGAIEQIYSERLQEFFEMLAYHYSRSDNTEKAYQYLRLAGEKATRSHSLLQAFHFFNQAYRLIRAKAETEVNQREQLEVLHLLLGPMALAGYPEGSLQLLAEGEELAKKIGDRKSLAMFYSRMGRYYGLKEGKPLLGIEYSERAFLEAEKIQDVELVIWAGSDLFPLYAVSGQSLKAVDKAKKIIQLVEQTKREGESFGMELHIYSQANGYCGREMAFLGRFEEGLVFLEKGLRYAATNDKIGLGWVEFTYGWHLNIRGQGEDATGHLRKAITIFEEAKFQLVVPITLYLMGWAHILTGEFDTARRHLERGFKIQKDVGHAFFESFYYLLLGMVHLDSGDLKSAQDNMEEAMCLAQNNNERQVVGYSKILLGRILSKTDPSKRNRAEELIMQGVEILKELSIRPWWSHGYLFLAEINADSGHKEKALQNIAKAESMFQEMGMDFWVAKTYALYADLHENEGDQPKAREHLGKAIEILKECGADGWVKKYEKKLAQL